MTSIDIYTILSSKPHNPHYLKRYIKFVENCTKLNETANEKLVKHHICPKANEMFPEYKSFQCNPWNMIKLTIRQHYIAHWLLFKIYTNKSMTRAFRMMCIRNDERITSKVYNTLMLNFKVSMSGKNNPNYGKTFKGRNAGRIRPLVERLAIGDKLRGKPKIKLQCPHCNKIGGAPAMKQHHFDNCYMLTPSRIVAKIDKDNEKLQRIERNGKHKIVTCPHCNKTGGAGPMKQHHFDKCKTISNDLSQSA